MPARNPSAQARLAGKTDQWFQRASAVLLSQVPCRAGCSHCCIGLFPVTRLDADLLREGLAQLPAQQQARIQRRASEQVRALEGTNPRLRSSYSLEGWSDKDIDRAVSDFDDVACPALGEDGLCALYAYRPLTCRSMGIPTESEGIVNGACSIQTFVPIVRLSSSLKAEEQELAGREAEELSGHQAAILKGEEILLPHAFLDLTDQPRAPMSRPTEADSMTPARQTSIPY
jgi:Fe-S-cluster containining protein